MSDDTEPEAMALATAGADGRPSLRIVLCRGIDARGIRFFTNYESRKGRDLEENREAAVLFHWASLGRQLRMEGAVERLSGAESDAYFRSRPRAHQISGLVSPQSHPIESLDRLRRQAAEANEQHAGSDIPRPPFWGGYLLRPQAIEFWTRGDDRLHDRVRFDLRDGAWHERRLAP